MDMSDESQREEIKDEIHQLEDIEQDEFDDEEEKKKQMKNQNK